MMMICEDHQFAKTSFQCFFQQFWMEDGSATICDVTNAGDVTYCDHIYHGCHVCIFFSTFKASYVCQLIFVVYLVHLHLFNIYKHSLRCRFSLEMCTCSLMNKNPSTHGVFSPTSTLVFRSHFSTF